MVLYSEFTYGSQFSEETNGLEIRFLVPEILNKYKRSIFLGTPCMLTSVYYDKITENMLTIVYFAKITDNALTIMYYVKIIDNVLTTAYYIICVSLNNRFLANYRDLTSLERGSMHNIL